MGNLEVYLKELTEANAVCEQKSADEGSFPAVPPSDPFPCSNEPEPFSSFLATQILPEAQLLALPLSVATFLFVSFFCR